MEYLKTYQQLFESDKPKYGCAMVYFDLPLLDLIQSTIEPEDVNDKGLESEPHATLLYGLHEEVSPDDALDLISGFEHGPISLGPVSVFANEEFDVLKFEAKADWLNVINAELVKLPHTSDFPDYKPHCTIAYLKPGTGQKYVDMFKGLSIAIDPKSFVYSTADRNKIERNIENNAA